MITFTRTTQTADPATGIPTPTVTTITGNAVRVAPRSKLDIERYAELGLQLHQIAVLLFTPTTYGDTPQTGDTVVWPATNGATYTVRDVNPIAPDGVTIAARVAVTR